MGAIAPTAKMLWGDALKSPHRNFAMSFLQRVKQESLANANVKRATAVHV